VRDRPSASIGRVITCWISVTALSGIFSILSMAFWVAFPSLENDAPRALFIIWAIFTSLLSGLFSALCQPTWRRWLPWTSASFIYFGIVIPNGINLIIRTKARFPSDPPPEPQPLLFLLFAVGFILVVIVSSLAARVPVRRIAQRALDRIAGPRAA